MQHGRRVVLTGFAALAACWCGGCSKPESTLADVTGTVTFHGLPASAEIVFEPERGAGLLGGRPSTALSTPDGAFRLNYNAAQSGAVIGRHRVLVKILPFSEGAAARTYSASVTPLKIARLTRDVSPGTNSFYFAITY
jgi:hypothetical protein